MQSCIQHFSEINFGHQIPLRILERVLALPVVFSRYSPASSGTPNSEVQLALPPVHESAFSGIPSLIRHCNVSSERWVSVVGENVREHCLEVTSLTINRYLPVGSCQGPFRMRKR